MKLLSWPLTLPRNFGGGTKISTSAFVKLPWWIYLFMKHYKIICQRLRSPFCSGLCIGMLLPLVNRPASLDLTF